MSGLLFVIVALAALGSALMAGFFFAFSAVTMQALGRISSERGIAAMQSINVVVLNPWFFTAFFGTAAICVVLAAYSMLDWESPRSNYLLAASVAYLVGVILVTIVRNVPLNNALAAVEPGSAQGDEVWARYLSVWTAWNHVRTVAPLLAAALFIMCMSV